MRRHRDLDARPRVFLTRPSPPAGGGRAAPDPATRRTDARAPAPSRRPVPAALALLALLAPLLPAGPAAAQGTSGEEPSAAPYARATAARGPDRVREEIRARLETPPAEPPPEAGAAEGAAGGAPAGDEATDPGAPSAPAAIEVAGESLFAPSLLLQFYERRGFAPAWSDGSAPLPAARGVVAAVRSASLEGLRPAAYHLAEIEAALRRVTYAADRGGADARELADLDLLLTDAYLTYGTHLLAGAVDPVTLDAHWSPGTGDLSLPDHLSAALRDDRIEASLRELFFASHPGYFRLRSALARYRELAAGGGWVQVRGADTLRPGGRAEGVSALRRRLRRTGDLAAEAGLSPEAPPDSFDAALAEAVKRFQGRHGLEPDGIVGPTTREALNVPAEERVRQLELNLERWRWLPRRLGERYVLVNIAAFQVEVRDHIEEVLHSRVIVGREYRETPVFSDTMRYLVLNPSWTVPPLIAVEDKLPLIRRDPSYLERYGYRLYAGWGADAPLVDPDTVDWAAMTASRFRGFRLHQAPGPQNALGRVKFMFPNRFDVYLHDTPERELFNRTVRDFSSGCIRVERAIELAEVVLRPDSAWTRERIEEVLASGRETTVSLPSPIPVHIQYWTAWTNLDGTVHFVRDLYGRDRALDEALERVLSRREAGTARRSGAPTDRSRVRPGSRTPPGPRAGGASDDATTPTPPS